MSFCAGIQDYRKTSTISATSLIPSPQVSKHQLPSPQGPPKSLNSPPGGIQKPLPPIPTKKPPIPTKKPPVLNRTLPSRLTQQVSLPAFVERHENDSKVYAAPLQDRSGKVRAATFAGEFHITPNLNSGVDSGFEEDKKYKSLNRDTMDHQPHYEDLRASMRSEEVWEGYDHDDDDGNLEDLYTATIAQNTVVDGTGPAEPQVPVAKSRVRSMPLAFNILGLRAPSPGIASLRAKSPMLTVTNVPLVRQSMDGEYVLPNEAYNGELLSPTREEGELPDYIDIA